MRNFSLCDRSWKEVYVFILLFVCLLGGDLLSGSVFVSLLFISGIVADLQRNKARESVVRPRWVIRRVCGGKEEEEQEVGKGGEGENNR